MLNLSRSPSRFSERETQKYCDAEDALYRSFWDAEGSLYRGVFDDPEEPGPGSILRDGLPGCVLPPECHHAGELRH